jgi:hypothetical protein
MTPRNLRIGVDVGGCVFGSFPSLKQKKKMEKMDRMA